ncbi:MAG: L,D-transpeptidase family protein [Chloroflexota bacterium]
MTSNKQFIQQEISRGIKAFKKGKKKIAWLHFQAALREDDENITALLWLAFLADDYDKRRFLLERVLVVDPDNQRAKDGLAWLQEKHPDDPDATDETISKQTITETEDSSVEARGNYSDASGGELENLIKQRLHDTLGTSELKEKAKKGTIAQRARRRIGPLLLLLVFGTILIGTILRGQWPGASDLQAASQATDTDHPPQVVFVAITKQAETLIAQAPTATPTATNLPTITPSPTSVSLTATTEPLAYSPKSESERWIEVDLSEQLVTAWEGTTPVMNFTASTGLPHTPTLVGQFRVYQKYVGTRMSGPGYDLPNVPFTMYYDRGYAVHGAYWHDNFGEPMSHGCVNLSPEDAEQIFHWAGPIIPDGASQATASYNNPGTLIVVHQ